MTASEKAAIYRRAVELVTSGWTPLGLAVDVNGVAVASTSGAAVAWSIAGAVVKACAEAGTTVAENDPGVLQLQTANGKLASAADAIALLSQETTTGVFTPVQ